jgi:hypothetical protein
MVVLLVGVGSQVVPEKTQEGVPDANGNNIYDCFSTTCTLNEAGQVG